MGEFDVFLLGGDGAGAGGVHVAHDDDPVRLVFADGFLEGDHGAPHLFGVRAGPDFEIHVGIGDIEGLEEGIRHGDIIVLAGVDQGVFEAAGMTAQLPCERRDLHEIRAGTDDRHYFELFIPHGTRFILPAHRLVEGPVKWGGKLFSTEPLV